MEEFAEFTEVACSLAPWVDRVKDHDPKWHEFGVLKHTLRVFQNARKIRGLTGIDIALWHDIGKFIPGVRQEKEDKPGEYRFKGHEAKPVDWLKENGPDFDNDEMFLIENHGIIRGDGTVQDIVKRCNGDSKRLKKLILLCVADISGKGFLDSQMGERKRLAPKFCELAWKVGLGDTLVNRVKEIVLTW